MEKRDSELLCECHSTASAGSLAASLRVFDLRSQKLYVLPNRGAFSSGSKLRFKVTLTTIRDYTSQALTETVPPDVL